MLAALRTRAFRTHLAARPMTSPRLRVQSARLLVDHILLLAPEAPAPTGAPRLSLPSRHPLTRQFRLLRISVSPSSRIRLFLPFPVSRPAACEAKARSRAPLDQWPALYVRSSCAEHVSCSSCLGAAAGAWSRGAEGRIVCIAYTLALAVRARTTLTRLSLRSPRRITYLGHHSDFGAPFETQVIYLDLGSSDLTRSP